VVVTSGGQSGTLSGGFTYTSGSGSIKFVQVGSNSNPQASVASISATYPQNQTAGDLNVIVVGWGDTTSSISSVTDSHGNNYAVAVAATVNTAAKLQQAIYYLKNISGGSTTVTVTFNQPAVYPDVRIVEYSGLNTSSPFDVSAVGQGTGSTASTSSVGTNSANELIFGAGTTVTVFSGAGTGFTSRIINVFGNIAEDKIVTSKGSYNAKATTGSVGWVMQMAAFKQ
jgi:hypothetical protein